VRAYLAAAKAGDCQLTRALTLPSTWSWCTHPKALDYRSIRKPQRVQPKIIGGVKGVVSVPFEVKTDGGSGIPPGWMYWSFDLIRTNDGWRVRDQGQG
jgi:hypothetical protein